eukprot:6819331-Pyramimonas_sp.AAC.1
MASRLRFSPTSPPRRTSLFCSLCLCSPQLTCSARRFGSRGVFPHISLSDVDELIPSLGGRMLSSAWPTAALT